MTKSKDNLLPGVGLDAGTMNFVAARRVGKNVKTTRLRDAFLDLPPENKRMLRLSNTSYVEMSGRLLVVGDEALSTANLFNREARRPMAGGVISAGELEAQGVIGVMVKQLLGDPISPMEKCCYSVPAPAVDVPDSDITYHKAIIGKILSELGYDPDPINEALAIIYSECGSENFSGLGISFGSGMTNVCLSYNAMSALEFSIRRGGDWIDRGASLAVGTTAAKACALKEKGIDITSPNGREEEAVALYVRELIDYALNSIKDHFHKIRNEILIPHPIPLIVSGGTSLAGGFLNMFMSRFDLIRESFPVEISEIRLAKDPITAVSTGLLLLSSMDDEDD